MNGLDYAILALIGFGAIYGLARGALRMATSILSTVIGLYAAFQWYEQAGAFAQRHLGTSQSLSPLIGYVAIFAIAFVAVEYAGGRLATLVNLAHLSWIDRLFGGAFGAALAAIVSGLTILLLTAILPINPPMLRDSRLAPRVLAYNQALLAYIPPQVKHLYADKRQELYRYWSGKDEGPATSPSSTK
jgi:membrane protein required for colicin V production